jgi:hypothetical protein
MPATFFFGLSYTDYVRFRYDRFASGISPEWNIHLSKLLTLFGVASLDTCQLLNVVIRQEHY